MSQTGTYNDSLPDARGLGLDLRLLRKGLVAASATVILLGIFREWFVAHCGVETVFQDMRHIALDAEMCLAAWYSSFLMLVSAGLLAAIARLAAHRGEGMVRYWGVLAIVFVGLSLDEATSVHELLLEPIRDRLHLAGPFYFAWVVPALVMVPLFALAYLRFLKALPRPYGLWFFISGAVFVVGALGMEMVGGVTYLAAGEDGLPYILSFLLEESLEISGLTIFLLALMSYLGRFYPRISIGF